MKPVAILKAFTDPVECRQALQDFAWLHGDIAQVNHRNSTVQLPHTKVYFRVLQNSADYLRIAGSVFSQVDLYGSFTHKMLERLRCRIRYPTRQGSRT